MYSLFFLYLSNTRLAPCFYLLHKHMNLDFHQISSFKHHLFLCLLSQFWFFFFKLMFLNWPMKNWCLWTVVLEKTIGSPLDYTIKPVTPKGTMPWIFIGRTDAEPEAPILWPPDAKNWLHRKDPDAGKERDNRGWDGWMISQTR